MRLITADAVQAFRNGQNFKRGNTQVIVKSRMIGTERWLKLHGNTIAHLINGEFIITSAGFQTNTTKERLNGFPNVDIRQVNYRWYLNGEHWDGSNKVVRL